MRLISNVPNKNDKIPLAELDFIFQHNFHLA